MTCHLKLQCKQKKIENIKSKMAVYSMCNEDWALSMALISTRFYYITKLYLNLTKMTLYSLYDWALSIALISTRFYYITRIYLKPNQNNLILKREE